MLNDMQDVVLFAGVTIVDVADTQRRLFGDKAELLTGKPVPAHDYRFHIEYGDGGAITMDQQATASEIIAAIRMSGRMVKARDLEPGDQVIACPAQHWHPDDVATVTRPELSTDGLLVGVFVSTASGEDKITQLDADADVIICARR